MPLCTDCRCAIIDHFLPCPFCGHTIMNKKKKARHYTEVSLVKPKLARK